MGRSTDLHPSGCRTSSIIDRVRRRLEARGIPLHTVSELAKFRICRLHWQDGQSWEEAGAYEHIQSRISRYGTYDGCRSHGQIVARYARLDALYDQVQLDGGLRPMNEVHTWAFREFGGVRFHVGADGELIFGRCGNHRFAIALILGLSVIPAQLGCVHVKAIPLLAKLRLPVDRG
jgi:hypothetical protein